MKLNPKFIIIGVLVLGVIIWALTRGGNPKVGPNFEGQVPAVHVENGSVKAVKLFADFSASMKGYIDFAGLPQGSVASNNMISATSTLLGKVESQYGIKSVSYCGGKEYNLGDFNNALTNKTVFSGATTLLDNMIKTATNAANDTTLTVVLSDMVLSYGGKRIDAEKDPDFNLHQLDALQANVEQALREAKAKGLNVVLLQYNSSFNGKYYYNYTENRRGKDAYVGKLLENRPFYLMLIGKEAALKQILQNDCYKPAEHIYASFETDLMEGKYTVKAKEAFWMPGEDQTAEGGFSTKVKDFSSSTFDVSCSDFNFPVYLSKDSIYGEANDKVSQTSMFVYDEPSKTLTFTVETMPAKTLGKKGELEVKIRAKNGWYWGTSMLDDVDKDPETLKNKTWGFSAIVGAIKGVYFDKHYDDSQEIGSIKIKYVVGK